MNPLISFNEFTPLLEQPLPSSEEKTPLRQVAQRALPSYSSISSPVPLKKVSHKKKKRAAKETFENLSSDEEAGTSLKEKKGLTAIVIKAFKDQRERIKREAEEAAAKERGKKAALDARIAKSKAEKAESDKANALIKKTKKINVYVQSIFRLYCNLEGDPKMRNHYFICFRRHNKNKHFQIYDHILFPLAEEEKKLMIPISWYSIDHDGTRYVLNIKKCSPRDSTSGLPHSLEEIVDLDFENNSNSNLHFTKESLFPGRVEYRSKPYKIDLDVDTSAPQNKARSVSEKKSSKKSSLSKNDENNFIYERTKGSVEAFGFM